MYPSFSTVLAVIPINSGQLQYTVPKWLVMPTWITLTPDPLLHYAAMFKGRFLVRNVLPLFYSIPVKFFGLRFTCTKIAETTATHLWIPQKTVRMFLQFAFTRSGKCLKHITVRMPITHSMHPVDLRSSLTHSFLTYRAYNQSACKVWSKSIREREMLRPDSAATKNQVGQWYSQMHFLDLARTPMQPSYQSREFQRSSKMDVCENIC